MKLYSSTKITNQSNTTASKSKDKLLLTIAIIGLMFAILMPPLGLALSLIALIVMRKKKTSGQLIATIGSIISAMTMSLILLLFIGVFDPENKAETEASFFIKDILKLEADKICDGGSPGTELGNYIPWYIVYLRTPDSDKLKSNITLIANQHSYDLEDDVELISNLKGVYMQSNNANDFAGSFDSYSDSSDYLEAIYNGRTLDIIIHRNSSVPLRCDFINPYDYGKKVNTGPDAIIELHLSLPSN